MKCLRNRLLLAVVVVVLSFLGQCLADQPPINITLSVQDLANMNGPTVIVSDTVKVYCLNNQSDYQVYNLNEQEFNSCSGGGSTIIGSCYHSVLSINIKTLAMPVSGQVSYVAGNTYYYAAFEINPLYGNITSYKPCQDGLKFTISVVSSEDNNVVSSSSSIMAIPSSSFYSAESTIQTTVQMTPTATAVISSSSMVTTTTTANTQTTTRSDTSTANTRPSTTSTSTRSSSSSDTTFIRPSNENIDSAANRGVFIGAGTGGILFIIIVISILVIAVAAICFVRFRRRNDEPYYINTTVEKGDTLRPILSSPTHTIPNGFDETPGCETTENQYEKIEREDKLESTPITFQQNNGCSHQLSTQSEEDSIKSTTSMDPLLGPSSPIRLYSIPLNTIEEGGKQDGGKQDDESRKSITGQDTLDNKETMLYTTSSFSGTVNQQGSHNGETSLDNNLLNLQDHFGSQSQQYRSIDDHTTWNDEDIGHPMN